MTARTTWNLILAVCCVSLIACGGEEPTTVDQDQDGSSQGKADDASEAGESVVKTWDLDELAEAGFREDAQIITNARIEGDQLLVDVAYGGGCEEHEFRMHWDGVFLESLPPQVNLALYHDANGDFCEAFLQDTLSFDLSGLAGDAVTVNLSGTEHSLLYEGVSAPASSGLHTGDIADLESNGYAEDGQAIRAARIDGTVLELDVVFGGGCEEHQFELHWDGAILESLPAQVNLALYHNSNGDFCEALLSETLRFDLAALGDGELVLNLLGSDLSIRLEEGAPGLFTGDPVTLLDQGYREAGIVGNVVRDGDLLSVDVSYGGGCEAHQFELHWNGAILESFPPQVNLTLYHNSNNDFCEALVSETLVFDVSVLEPDVVINLSGADGSL